MRVIEPIFLVAGVGVIVCGLIVMVYGLNKRKRSAAIEPTEAQLRAAKDSILNAPTVDALCAETAVRMEELVGADGAFISLDEHDARSGKPLTIESETVIRLSRGHEMVKQKSIVAHPIMHNGAVVGLIAADGGHKETLSALARFVTESYAGRHTKKPQDRLARAAARSGAKVDFDGLTGVGNRRRFDTDLADVVAESGEEKIPVSLAMFDIDNFRYYNEAHGKQAGNEVLRSIAELIASNLRGTDVVYRYSGVKFVALLPGATVENGYAVVERIRKAVESTDFEGGDMQPTGRVTMSIGIAEAPADQTDSLIEAADAALVKAKESGRNTVVIEADIQ